MAWQTNSFLFMLDRSFILYSVEKQNRWTVLQHQLQTKAAFSGFKLADSTMFLQKAAMDCTPKPCPPFEDTGKPWSLNVTGVV